MNVENKQPNCRQCRHYKITWDKDLPYGCSLYGIKGRKSPALIVKESSGIECLGFEQKPIKKSDSDPYGP